MSKQLERCQLCDEPTGRCGEDSVYIDASDNVQIGPLCEECLNGIVHWVASDACISPNQQALAAAKAEIERLKCENEDLRAQVTTGETGQQILLQGHAKLQARVEELERPVGELIAAWVDQFGEIGVDDSADRCDRAMAAVMAALGHRSWPQEAKL